MKHRYYHIDRNTECSGELKNVKAWRSILIGHDLIRFHIAEVRRSLYDMGVQLSPRGKRFIETMLKEGWTWHDPHPNISLTNSQKTLLQCVYDMKHRWKDLRMAELAATNDVVTREPNSIQQPKCEDDHNQDLDNGWNWRGQARNALDTPAKKTNDDKNNNGSDNEVDVHNITLPPST